MDTFRKDVKALMGSSGKASASAPSSAKKPMYRVRKSWADSKSQIGACVLVIDDGRLGSMEFQSFNANSLTESSSKLLFIAVCKFTVKRNPFGDCSAVFLILDNRSYCLYNSSSLLFQDVQNPFEGFPSPT